MEFFLKALGVLALVLLLALLMAYPTMWLWNWLMPIIFGLTKVTFWQALGLNMLSGILLKNTSLSSSK